MGEEGVVDAESMHSRYRRGKRVFEWLAWWRRGG